MDPRSAALLRESTQTGLIAAAAVTGELMLAGMREAGSPWAPLNAVAPLLLTPEAAESREWHPTFTPVGLGITVCGIAGWAGCHTVLLRAALPESHRDASARAAAGVLSAAALAAFDYCLLPPSRRPRFSRWLSTPAIVAKYAVLAAALALNSGETAPSR